VYVWVDGIHFNVRLEDDRLCTLVMIGVRPDGTKELITVEDGYRESAESWKTVLRDLKRRGTGSNGGFTSRTASSTATTWPSECGSACAMATAKLSLPLPAAASMKPMYSTPDATGRSATPGVVQASSTAVLT
jgi:hypothetical protein